MLLKRRIDDVLMTGSLDKMSGTIESLRKKQRTEGIEGNDIITGDLETLLEQVEKTRRLSWTQGRFSPELVKEYFDLILPIHKECFTQAKLGAVKNKANLIKVLEKTWDIVVTSGEAKINSANSTKRFNKTLRKWAIKNKWYEDEWTHVFLCAIEYLLHCQAVVKLNPGIFAVAKAASCRWYDNITMIESLSFISDSAQVGEQTMKKLLNDEFKQSWNAEKFACYLSGAGIDPSSLNSGSIFEDLLSYVATLIPMFKALSMENNMEVFSAAFLSCM